MKGSKSLIARIAVFPATFVLVAAAAPCALATDRFVPKAYKTIQAAIDASTDGDNVRVMGGTYHENINLLGKSLSMWNEGPGPATIDGDHLGACVTINSGDPSVFLEGFRLINGAGLLDTKTGLSYGGGICQTSGYLSINLCTFKGCEATWGGALFVGNVATAEVNYCLLDRCNVTAAPNRGGGIAVADATVSIYATTIQDCGTTGHTAGGGGIHAVRSNFYIWGDTLITGNAAAGGGGLWLEESHFLVTASVFGNAATQVGGGAAVHKCHEHSLYGVSRFDGCDFTYNAAESADYGSGGGLFLYDSAVDLNGCDLHYNGSKQGGGLATLLGSGSTMEHCSFRGNTARTGAGIYVNEAAFELTSSIIAENNALFLPPLPGDGGGGICSVNGRFGLVGCTITENRALANASGIFHASSYGRPHLIGTIVWGNGGPGLARNIEDRGAYAPLLLIYCDQEVGDDPHGGSNFAVDPLFDRASFVYDLLPTSPLIDVVHEGISFDDFDGDLRLQDGNGDGWLVNDCGAQEWHY